MIGQRFEVKFRGRLGPCQSDQKSMRILNRVVEWSEEGIRYEADQRHAEIIVKHLGEQECQREMRRMGAQLQKGATEFIGYYICDHCDVAVEVRLRAHPDVPYELYQSSASTLNKEESK